MTKCLGCGVELQYDQPKLIGYSPKKDATICQRCFRLTHYNDVVVSMRESIPLEEVLQKVNKLDVLVCWVVDLFDFEAGLLPSLARHLPNKDIVLVAGKRDLLPKTLGNDKLIQFIRKRCKAANLEFKAIVLCSDLVKHARSEENFSVNEVLNTIDVLRNGKDVALVGMANAGKSTLLNAILMNQSVTTSAHPGTTLDVNPIQFEDYILYDTPGCVNEHSMLTYIEEADLKSVIPMTALKPMVFQLKGNQTLSIGGLARIDFIGCEQFSCTTYVSNELSIHRSKQEKADELWEKHYGDILKPILSKNLMDIKKTSMHGDKMDRDIVIEGLGFITLHGHVSEVHIYVDERVNVTFREAMI